jgi:hypothetical protein
MELLFSDQKGQKRWVEEGVNETGVHQGKTVVAGKNGRGGLKATASHSL